ncbi:MAG: BatA and WFA domain-containing protein [Bryobacteraceae bacterium]
MGFLAPWFLAGAAMAGLPLYLHLLRQYRATPQPFSSLMFFERRVQSSVKHRRLRYLLLLALRIAVLVLLALAFANPFVNRTNVLAAGKKLTVIAVDRSFSMRYGGRLAQAKRQASQILNSASGGDAVEVLAVDHSVEVLAAPQAGREVAHAAIESIQPVDRASSYGELARSLRIIEQNTGMRLDVHFISDMQQTSLPPAFADLQLGPHTVLTLQSVGAAESPNWAVEAVVAPARVFDPKQVRVAATITGWQTPAMAKKASLYLDNKLVASHDITVAANGHTQTEFSSFDVPYGSHRGEVRLEPHDALPNDDVFLFAMERSDPQPALFVSGGRSRDVFYYRTAMDAATNTGLTIQPVSWGQASTSDFSHYAYVVISDDGGVDAAFERKLTDYVRRGGSLFILLGSGSLLHNRVPVTGDHVAETHDAQIGGAIDDRHPALAGVGQLQNVQFFRPLLIQPGQGSHILAKLADGSPLLVEEPLGEGRILIFASAFDNLANDFPLHTSFVPFVAQTGRYLAGLQEASSSVVAGLPVELRRGKEEGAAADVVDPDGRHLLSLREASIAASFEPGREGFYEVHRANGRRVLLAVHADRRESDLTPVPPETLSLWRNMGDASARSATAVAEQQTRPWSLWRFVLMLVLAAAIAESIFASRYLKEERQTA